MLCENKFTPDHQIVENHKTIKMNLVEKGNQIGGDNTDNNQLAASLNDSLMDKKTKTKLLRVLALTLTIAAASIITSCNTPAEKVENSENDVIEAQHDLEKANAQYLEDVEDYRVKARDRINANNQRIIELKAHTESMNKEEKVKYQNQIDKLEQKNDNLKERLDDYKAESKDDWQSFKTEFSNDMNELGSALKSFTTDDK